MIRLIARSVPFEHASRVLRDDTSCELIKINTMVANRERFIKRRARLVGENGATLKAIELLTQCYVAIQGGTVAAVGPHSGLKTVGRLVDDCMHNVHPIYEIKSLMLKRELSKNEKLRNESWQRFLPPTKQRAQTSKEAREAKKKRKAKWKKKADYTPFPPSQPPSKVDMQLESGEYFLDQHTRARKAAAERTAAQVEKQRERTRKRAAVFEPPSGMAPRAKRTADAAAAAAPVDTERLKKKLAKQQHKEKRAATP